MSFLLAKYNTQTTFYFPIVKRNSVDLAATADWTPATGDTKVSKDGGNFANTSNNPAAVGGTGSVGWSLVVTATELSAAVVNIQIVDSATKAVEDQYLTIYTYGHASAKIQVDLSDVVRAGLTALPNAAAEAAGGLYTRGTGAGQVNQSNNGEVDTKTVRFTTDALDAAALKADAVTEIVTAILAGFAPAEFKAASGTATTVVLPSGASAVDDFYNGFLVVISGGTGIGQARRVFDYTGASRTVTIATGDDWDTTPDATSIVLLLRT